MIGEDLRLFLQGNSLINFVKFYMIEKKFWVLLTHNSRGVILLRFRLRFCIVGSLCLLRKSLHLSHTVHCSEANFKCGRVRPCATGRVLSKSGCQTRGQYDQMSQNVQWGVLGDSHQLQEDRGLPGCSQSLLGECTEPVRTY